MIPRPATRPWRVLAKRVSQILHTVWDPLGVDSEPGAQMEYDDYVPEIVRLLVCDASADGIAARIEAIRREHMGLPGHEARDRQVAMMLIALTARRPPLASGRLFCRCFCVRRL